MSPEIMEVKMDLPAQKCSLRVLKKNKKERDAGVKEKQSSNTVGIYA
jgi:hypothetical protein